MLPGPEMIPADNILGIQKLEKESPKECEYGQKIVYCFFSPQFGKAPKEWMFEFQQFFP